MHDQTRKGARKMTNVKLYPTPVGSINIVGYRPEYHADDKGVYQGYVDNKQTFNMVRRKSTWVLTTNRGRRMGSQNEDFEYEGHDWSAIARDHSRWNGNGYMKQVEFIIIKVKPAISDGVHPFEVMSTNSSMLELVKKYNTTVYPHHKRKNLYDTTYILGMRGVKIDREEWLANALAEEEHHTTMRKIFKMPNIWRSYPNLYPIAKEKIPYFTNGGSILSETSILEVGVPFPRPNESHMARSLPYVNYINGFGNIRPTFDSPNVNSFNEHGYQQLA